MERMKKNSVFTFLFSLIPGAAEMYMGFMKSGLSIMGLFALCFIIPSLLHANDVWILAAMVLYAFAFFHARNLAARDEKTFALLEDRWVWEEFISGKDFSFNSERILKWTAWILIIFGALALWNNFRTVIGVLLPDEGRVSEIIYDMMSMVPSAVFSVIVILVGVKLIKGRKIDLNFETPAAPAAERSVCEGDAAAAPETAAVTDTAAAAVRSVCENTAAAAPETAAVTDHVPEAMDPATETDEISDQAELSSAENAVSESSSICGEYSADKENGGDN